MINSFNKSVFLFFLTLTLLVGTQISKANTTPDLGSQRQSSETQTLKDKNGRMIEVFDLEKILPYIDKRTLVIFDLDYILFRSKTSLGAPEWMNYFIKQDLAKGLSHEESLQQHYPAWMRAQNLNEMELMDQKIPVLLKELRKKAFAYIAVTTRCPVSAEITIWQLNKFDISFSEHPISEFKYNPAFKHPTLYRDGILFTHILNKKSAVFEEWLYQYFEETHQKKIEKIVFIDSVLPTLHSMEKIALNLGINFIGVRYALADRYKARFKPKLAEQEYKILMSNLSESETHLLLDDLGSYADD